MAKKLWNALDADKMYLKDMPVETKVSYIYQIEKMWTC